MQFFGLLHRPNFTDQGPDFATRDQLKRFDHFNTGDITTAENLLFLVQKIHGGELEWLSRTAECHHPAALAERLGASLQRRRR
jgi:hypothetical protein